MFGNIKKLNQLTSGMTLKQARDVLGEPAQTELKAGKTALKYRLHQWMDGWKPIYLVFNENQLLEEWHVNEEEFMERQKIWLEAWRSIEKRIDK
jgi:hypothetical protein